MKRFMLTVACLMAALGLNAQSGGKGSGALPDKLVIGVLKGPTGIGLIRLIESSDSLKNGVRISYEIAPSVDIMLAKISSGEVDVAALPSNTAAKLYNGGVPYVLGAVIGNGMLSYISSDPGIRGPADLKGKAIAVSGQGAVPEYVFRLILEQAGIDPEKDLRLDFSLAYPEAVASLIAGKISDAVLPEPFATMALAGNTGLKVPFDIQGLYAQAGGSPSYPISVLVVKKDTAAKYPAEVSALLDLAKDSIEWVKANPEKAGLSVEKLEFGMKAKIAALSIPKANYVFSTAKRSRKELEALFTLLLSRNKASLGGKLPDDAFYAF
jgi:NitT/TauT family transport system substrate-binding protein